VITPSIWPTPTGRDWKDGSAKACANIPVNGLLGPARISNELAQTGGGYFYHQRPRAPNPIATDIRIQEELLAECGRISGIRFD